MHSRCSRGLSSTCSRRGTPAAASRLGPRLSLWQPPGRLLRSGPATLRSTHSGHLEATRALPVDLHSPRVALLCLALPAADCTKRIAPTVSRHRAHFAWLRAQVWPVDLHRRTEGQARGGRRQLPGTARHGTARRGATVGPGQPSAQRVRQSGSSGHLHALGGWAATRRSHWASSLRRSAAGGSVCFGIAHSCNKQEKTYAGSQEAITQSASQVPRPALPKGLSIAALAGIALAGIALAGIASSMIAGFSKLPEWATLLHRSVFLAVRASSRRQPCRPGPASTMQPLPPPPSRPATTGRSRRNALLLELSFGPLRPPGPGRPRRGGHVVGVAQHRQLGCVEPCRTKLTSASTARGHRTKRAACVCCV